MDKYQEAELEWLRKEDGRKQGKRSPTGKRYTMKDFKKMTPQQYEQYMRQQQAGF